MSLTETLIESQPGRFGLWPSVWKLLRLRLRITYNVFKRSKLRNKIGTVIISLLILGFVGFMFFLSTLLLRFLNSPELAQYINPDQFLSAIPTLILTAAFFITLMTNFGVLLQALYLSRDMDFLITSPIPMRAVFVAKLLEAILPSFAIFCAFSLPVLFGLGAARGYNILYDILLIILLGLLSLAAGGVASVLVMGVVRLVPARRVAEVLGFIGAMVSILCGQSGNLIRVVNPNGEDFGSLLSAFSRVNAPWSPFAWAGNGLNAIGRGEWLTGIGLSALALLLVAGIFGGTLLLAENLYYTGWSSMQGTARKRRKAQTTVPVITKPAIPAFQGQETSAFQPAAESYRPARLIPSAVRGLIIKDLRLLRRDPANYAQLITPLIVGFVFLFTTRAPRGLGARNATSFLNNSGLQNLETYSVVVLAIFVAWMLMFNLATLAFTREGRNYWMLKTAPIRPAFLLVGKFTVSFLVSLAFSLIYLTLAMLVRGLEWTLYPFCVLILMFSVAGACGIAVAFGAAGANLEWDNPRRQRLSGGSGCLVFIGVSVFLLFDLALFFLPVGLWQIFGGSTPFLAYLVSLLLGGGASIAAIAISMVVALPKVPQIGDA